MDQVGLHLGPPVAGEPRKDVDPSALAGEPHRPVDHLRHPNADDGDVDPDTAGRLRDHLRHVPGVGRNVGAENLGEPAAPLRRLAHDDGSRAGEQGELDVQETDGAGPDHEHRIIHAHAGLLLPVDAAGERLGQRELFGRQVVGDEQVARLDGFGRDADVIA